MVRATSAAFVAAAIVLLASSANAAITVLGNGLAQVCFQTAEFGGNPTDGIAACTEALDQSALNYRDRAATLINRGILYSRINAIDTALRDYNDGLALNPAMAEGYVDRGAAFIVLHRYDEALQDLNKGIAMNSKRLHIAYYDRAIVQEALGNVRGAYEDYKKAVELQPDFTLASQQLARFKVIRHEGT